MMLTADKGDDVASLVLTKVPSTSQPLPHSLPVSLLASRDCCPSFSPACLFDLAYPRLQFPNFRRHVPVWDPV